MYRHCCDIGRSFLPGLTLSLSQWIPGLKMSSAPGLKCGFLLVSFLQSLDQFSLRRAFVKGVWIERCPFPLLYIYPSADVFIPATGSGAPGATPGLMLCVTVPTLLPAK